ncbi:MAG TPA: hypothetical protein VLE53_05530 [Gemmatimonadaceae bacterium]|nr:hypothetical protein [Gemmatimonadaceae bacterium]
MTTPKWALLFVALAAFALQRGATLPLAWTPLTGGYRYEITPVGLTHLNDSGAVVADCRWWPRHGDATLCAPGSHENAVRHLRWVYPLLATALWVAVGALFLQVLRIPRQRGVRLGVTWAVSLLAATGLWFFGSSVRPALAVLAGTDVRFATLGAGLVVAAVLLAAASGWLHRTAPPRSAPPPAAAS